MIKLANIPTPPRLTEEDLERLAEEGGALQRLVDKGTAKMERLTADDFAAKIYSKIMWIGYDGTYARMVEW